MARRGELVMAQAEQWIDVPFRWHGRVRAGCDCKGMVAGIAAELGFPEAASLEALSGDYSGKVPVRRLLAGLTNLFDRVEGDDRLPGDILVLLVKEQPQHLALAAPRPNKPDRVIEALHDGPQRVRPMRRPAGAVHSIWRWREDLD